MPQRTLDLFLISRFCQTCPCQSIDFGRLCESVESRNEKYRPTLGTVQEILARFESRQCTFCLCQRDDGTLHCYIDREIFAKQYLLSLQPCADPIPHVNEIPDFPVIPRPPLLPSGRRIGHYYEPRLIRQWMSCCYYRHGSTCWEPEWTTSEDAQLPGIRVVDVVQGCIVDAPKDCQYLALSYVWGSAQRNKLLCTRETIQRFLQPGQLTRENIPKTIQDAFTVTWSIGFRYIWIDSLCIIQDDDVDKLRQLSYMDCVYTNAYATIIAASAVHADIGITGVSKDLIRNPRQAVIPIPKSLSLMRSTQLFTGIAYEDSIWKRRAWTMQESPLSRRTILFTDDEVFWRYQRATWCESLAHEPKIISSNVFGCYDLMKEEQPSAFRPENCYQIVMEYAKPSVTNPSDALNAIQFPSWSWLGWNLEHGGLGRLFNLPSPTAMFVPELEFCNLGIGGEVRPLMPPELFNKYTTPLGSSALDPGIVSKWKGSAKIEVDDSEDFRDSGHLVFWTSTAALHAHKVFGNMGRSLKIGAMSEHGCSSSAQTGLHHFIVITRVHDRVQVHKVLPKLHVLMVEWDVERRVAHRIGTGEVDEGAWAAVQPEWVKVILK
ncbi:heterokaryon incompatibility protein-domain-containing protein [Phaeosphaeriaceae sp. PMI808]|nr:heterokaryon incompatibility protein-domain-containing protein [Phaeosphaeriaceae sp. PMI808]